MRYWIASILMTLLLVPGRSGTQTKLSAKWEELTAGDFKEAFAKSQGTCCCRSGFSKNTGLKLQKEFYEKSEHPVDTAH